MNFSRSVNFLKVWKCRSVCAVHGSIRLVSPIAFLVAVNI